MAQHVGVFQERVEPTAVGGHREVGLEGIRGKGDDRQEERRDDGEHHQHPGHELPHAPAVAPCHQGREDDEDPLPQEQRPLQGAPQPGDAVVDGGVPGGVEGDVADGEIGGHQRVDQRPRGRGDEHELAQDGVAGGDLEAFAARARVQDGGGDAPKPPAPAPGECSYVPGWRSCEPTGQDTNSPWPARARSSAWPPGLRLRGAGCTPRHVWPSPWRP